MVVYFYYICANIAIMSMSWQASNYYSSQDSQPGKNNYNFYSPVVNMECTNTMKVNQKRWSFQVNNSKK